MPSMSDDHNDLQHITLSKNSKLNQSLIDEMDLFVDTVAPGSLKQHILELYFTYLIREGDMLPWDISALSANIYFLMSFLDKLEANIGAEGFT